MIMFDTKDMRRNWPIERMVGEWDRFSKQNLSAESLGSFERRLGRFKTGGGNR